MQKTIFYSKVDAWLIGTILVAFVPCIVPLWAYPMEWEVVLTLSGIGLLLCFAIYLMFTITYTVEEETLTVRVGHLFRYARVRIEDIQRVESTHCLLSAPAASIHRLRIKYGKYNELLISPKREEEFLTVLQQRNPKIEMRVTSSGFQSDGRSC